jgi:heme O synthase-like polyprenyltransferase
MNRIQSNAMQFVVVVVVKWIRNGMTATALAATVSFWIHVHVWSVSGSCQADLRSGEIPVEIANHA